MTIPAEPELTKVHVPLSDNPHSGGEALWALPLGDDVFELRNVPFFAYGLNYGDVVYAVEPDPTMKPSVLRVVRPSGHRTLWVTFRDDGSKEERCELLTGLNQWKAFFENADGTSSPSTWNRMETTMRRFAAERLASERRPYVSCGRTRRIPRAQ